MTVRHALPLALVITLTACGAGEKAEKDIKSGAQDLDNGIGVKSKGGGPTTDAGATDASSTSAAPATTSSSKGSGW